MSLLAIYWTITTVASVVLILFLLLTFIGIEAHPSFDHLTDTIDGIHFKMVSVRNLVVFFAMFGWSGIALIKGGHGHATIFFGSFLIGLIMMAVTAFFFYVIAKNAVPASINYEDGVGKTATVYTPIPVDGIG